MCGPGCSRAISCPWARGSIRDPFYRKSLIRWIPSPFINNKSNTGHVVTDVEMQDVVCGDFKAGRSSAEYFWYFCEEKENEMQILCLHEIKCLM